MLSRTVLRSARATRIPPAARRNVRFASSAAPQSAGGAGAVTGGLAGGAAALAITYAWYSFSGAKTAVQTAQEAQGYVDSVKNSLKVKFQEQTPDTNQAIEQLRSMALSYAAFIPGGKVYVDSIFKDLDAIKNKHGEEVEKIVREAYEELRDVSKKGMSLETASDSYQVLSKHSERLVSLAGDASEDILNNHPQLKEKLGGSTDQLKELANRYGPEAKKEVDETWKQINDVLKAGFSVESVNRVRQLVQEKIEKIKELGEKAFNQGIEQLQPMLEKNPQIKKFVEENKDALKQGNAAEVVEKVRSAISSGSTEQLESYIKEAKNKTQQFSGAQLSQWLDAVPNGSQIIPQLMKVKDIAENRGQEAESIVKDIVNEIKKVLDSKREDVEKLYEKSKEDVKKESSSRG